MLEGILQGLMQWLYGLFLDLVSYCANALLGVMSTDLGFFEESVPIVLKLYKIFVAVGWGLLIGNLAFQSMKAMFSGFGFETESPAILVLRTFLFGTLLVFSKDVCDIGLSIGKKVIDLLGIPKSVKLTMPDDSFFTGGASWLLVIIIGFILGFQLIKLFFEIAERYVVVAVLTLLMPVGLAMGGSKSTKEICSGFVRTYASMIALMVTNVLFLKLILSALATMPSGTMVLPWCLVVVGLAKTARKTDSLISKIGLNATSTGDPLGSGRGMMAVTMAARNIISSARNARAAARNAAFAAADRQIAKNQNFKGNSNKGSKGGKGGGKNHRSGNYNNKNNQQTRNNSKGNNRSNNNSNSSSRFGSQSYNSAHQNGNGGQNGGAGGKSKVNSNRFETQKGNVKSGGKPGNKAGGPNNKNGKNGQKPKQNNSNKQSNGANNKKRFGNNPNGSYKHNPNPMKNTGKTSKPNNPGNKMPNASHKNNVAPDNTRFGGGRSAPINDDDILITKDDDNNG